MDYYIPDAKKRVYITLLLGCIVLAVSIISLLFEFAGTFGHIILGFIISLLLLWAVLFSSRFIILFLNINKTFLFKPIMNLNKRLNFIIYRHIEYIGTSVGIDDKTIKRSLIKINNTLFKVIRPKYLHSNILLLLPHCIQNSSCDVKISLNVHNCKGCGRCQITDLIILSKQYAINLAVASGGTAARQHIILTKPTFIIAVACENDLISGILDMWRLPVYGIINHRPMGPCRDTGVLVSEIEEVLNMVTETVRESSEVVSC